MNLRDAARAVAGGSPAESRPALSLPIVASIAGFTMIAMYCMYVSLHTIDVGTGSVAATESLKQYHQALEGGRDFPYQWRLLGIYLVFAGERLTGLNPHAVDVVVKALLLFSSSLVLFLFCCLYTSEISALGAVGLYLLLTVAGFTDQYTIYFTNDFAVIACWFAAVYCLRTGRPAAAIVLAFVGAWAKETMLLVPVLMGLQWLRTRSGFGRVVLAALAFLIPSAILRTAYQAPLAKWAWWDMLFANVPFLQSSMYEFTLTMKNNVKVALFYNVFWLLAARRVLQTHDPFVRELAVTGIVYLLLAYPVIYIRELRHFLPLAIIVLPMAMAELESGASTRRDPARPRS